jgi:hypothetical protein
MPQLLYPQGKGPRYPLDRRLGRPQSQSGHSGEEKNNNVKRFVIVNVNQIKQ